MNEAHWHLQLNHIPIISIMVGFGILVTGFVIKNTSVKRTALWVFIFSALMAVPAYITGEGAEDIAEKLPGVDERIIEEHEELAALFIWLAGALGIIALLTFITDVLRLRASRFLYITVFIAAVACMLVSKQLGTSGGEIRHTEIRANSPANTGGESPKSHDDD